MHLDYRRRLNNFISWLEIKYPEYYSITIRSVSTVHIRKIYVMVCGASNNSTKKNIYKIIYNNQLWFKYQPRTKHTQNNTQQSTVESVAKDCMVHIVTYSVLVGTIAIMLCGWGYIWHTQQFTTFYRIWYIDISWYRASQEYLWWNIWRLYQTCHTAFSMHDISYSSYYTKVKYTTINYVWLYDYMYTHIYIICNNLASLMYNLLSYYMNNGCTN